MFFNGPKPFLKTQPTYHLENFDKITDKNFSDLSQEELIVIRKIINTVVVGWLLAEDNFFLQMYGDKSCLCNKQI